MTKTKQKLPKWFNGTVYEIGDEVRNPFSGETYFLNAKELSMYDFIKGSEYSMELLGHKDWIIRDMQKGLDWFRTNNPKAYMVLLD
jgi:hypothetical protein